MRKFWYYIILTCWAGKLVKQGCLKQVSRYMGGNSYDLIWGITLAFTWRGCGKHENSLNRSLCQDLNLGPPKYKTDFIMTGSTFSVAVVMR